MSEVEPDHIRGASNMVGSPPQRIIVDPEAAAHHAAAASGSTITIGTLRSWVKRHHINRYPGGYCLLEIDAWLARRNMRMVRRPPRLKTHEDCATLNPGAVCPSRPRA